MTLHHFQKCGFHLDKILIMGFGTAQISDIDPVFIFICLFHRFVRQNFHLHTHAVTVDHHRFSRKFLPDFLCQRFRGRKISVAEFHTSVDSVCGCTEIAVFAAFKKMQSGNFFVIKYQVIHIIVNRNFGSFCPVGQHFRFHQFTAAVHHNCCIFFDLLLLCLIHLDKFRCISVKDQLLPEMFHTISGCKGNFLPDKKNLAFFHRKFISAKSFPQGNHLFHNILRLLILKNKTFPITFYTFHRCAYRKHSYREAHGNDLGGCVGEGLRPYRRDQEHINILLQGKPRDLFSCISSCLGKYRAFDLFIGSTDQSQTDTQIILFDIFCKRLHNFQAFFVAEHTDETDVKGLCGLSGFLHCRKIMWCMRDHMEIVYIRISTLEQLRRIIGKRTDLITV